VHQIRFCLGLRARTRWGSSQRSPTPLVVGKGACCPFQDPILASALWVSVLASCGARHRHYQWWTYHKSNHKYKSQIICKNDLNQNLKSKIKSQIIKSNPNHFWSKSNQITNQFYQNVKFLKMSSLHNNYRISQKITTVLHMPIIVSSRSFLISEFQSVLSCLLEMDNGFTTKQWKHGRRRSSITRNNIVLW